MLEFLVPILNPDRPSRTTVTLASTIVVAVDGERKVYWDLVMKDVVDWMVLGVGKSKTSGLSPYLFHLYRSLDLLRATGETAYHDAEVMLTYNIKRDSEREVEEEKEKEDSTVIVEEKRGDQGKGNETVGKSEEKIPSGT